MFFSKSCRVVRHREFVAANRTPLSERPRHFVFRITIGADKNAIIEEVEVIPEKNAIRRPDNLVHY
jgi:hypothetical protein